MRVFWSVAVMMVAAAPCFAQQARLANVSIDSSMAVDRSMSPTGAPVDGTVVDSVMSVGLGRHFEATVRPWAQR